VLISSTQIALAFVICQTLKQRERERETVDAVLCVVERERREKRQGCVPQRILLMPTFT